MPKTSFTTILWLAFLSMATLFLFFGAIDTSQDHLSLVHPLHVFGKYSALIFSMFSAIFSLLALSFSINTSLGHKLTLTTIAISTILLGLTTALLFFAPSVPDADLPALAAAFMMVLRAFGVALLPPRGDRSGLREAFMSLTFASLTAAAWWVADPQTLLPAATASLLLSWPYLLDGINAFADKVFHRAALAAGARDLTADAFSRITQARDIIIDKAALMSGPDLMVTNVMAFNNEPKTLLAVAASAEAGSSHPVAAALRQLASQWQVNVKMPDRFEPAPGLGVVALLGGQTVVIGTPGLLKELKIDSFTADAIARSLEADGKTVLRVAVAGRVVGVLGLEGTLRQDAGVAGMALRAEGLVPWLFTGDSPNTRVALADMLGLENLSDPAPGETAFTAAARTCRTAPPLVLTLSHDRSSLQLCGCDPETGGRDDAERTPIAVSDTDDVGAFPALKALAMRRNLLARHARRFLTGLWAFAGLCGALVLVPFSVTPFLFVICLAILWAFARFSVADTLQGTPATR